MDAVNYSSYSVEIPTSVGVVPPNSAIVTFVKTHHSSYIRMSGFSDYGPCRVTLEELERQLRLLFPRESVGYLATGSPAKMAACQRGAQFGTRLSQSLKHPKYNAYYQ